MPRQFRRGKLIAPLRFRTPGNPPLHVAGLAPAVEPVRFSGRCVERRVIGGPVIPAFRAALFETVVSLSIPAVAKPCVQ